MGTRLALGHPVTHSAPTPRGMCQMFRRTCRAPRRSREHTGEAFAAAGPALGQPLEDQLSQLDGGLIVQGRELESEITVTHGRQVILPFALG